MPNYSHPKQILVEQKSFETFRTRKELQYTAKIKNISKNRNNNTIERQTVGVYKANAFRKERPTKMCIRDRNSLMICN